MILVLAADGDVEAARFVQGWDAPRAHLLTPMDLSTPHWLHAMQHSNSNQFGIRNEPYRTKDISAVLVLLPGIRDTDLLQIVPEDRAYVAAEMNAFLFFWLSDLKCPVINQPQAGSLMGPAWGLERWRWEAHAAGFPLWTQAIERDGVKSISVVGEEVYGDADHFVREAALQLARSANTLLLTLMLVNDQFLYAHARPELNNQQVVQALRALIHREIQ